MTKRSAIDVAPRPAARGRVVARGRFLECDGERFLVRGVTYGTFRGPDGSSLPDQAVCRRDLSCIAAAGFNVVRIYTVPPRWFLDEAWAMGLRLMVGTPWQTHRAVLESSREATHVLEQVRAGVAACASHPGILCYSVGNEVPASIVRWHGAARVERFIGRLQRVARDEDPSALVTYSSYPSTEFLDLPESDFVSFNVYLEEPDAFAAYIDRLHTIAADRPLVITELGLDSGRHGVRRQAAVLDHQVRTAMRAGCAGTVVFSWTDEWHRGGQDVLDWQFGLTGRSREPKPALAAVARAMGDTPFPAGSEWPSVSVVLCTHNGEPTIAETSSALTRLDYPAYDVLVVDDGSTDECAAIARADGHQVIRTDRQGLGRARNTGIAATSGEIVAFIDDDAVPERQWLRYLVDSMRARGSAGAGGPNLAPPSRTGAELALSCAPGGPREVLRSGRLAEHVPGCNMAFWRTPLTQVGGFDQRFTAAGDDVDLCWRLHDAGHDIAFAPGAVVWHRRRATVGAYWRQQRGYGRAEALLERKWPSRHNTVGHIRWSASIYGGATIPLLSRRRIRHGVWGLDDFQHEQAVRLPTAAVLPSMPEWNLATIAFSVLALLGLVWPPLLFAAVPAILTLFTSLALAFTGARNVRARLSSRRSRPPLLRLGFLHLLQPFARLRGRLEGGLTPWRRRGRAPLVAPHPRRLELWRESWRSMGSRLQDLEHGLRDAGFATQRGDAFSRWDIEVRGGALGAVRIRTACEEHGQGRQLVRISAWPRPRTWVGASVAGLVGLGAIATLDGSPGVGVFFVALGVLVMAAALRQVATAMGGLVATATSEPESPITLGISQPSRRRSLPAAPASPAARPVEERSG